MGNKRNILAGDGLSRLKGAVRHWGIYLGMGLVLEIVPKSIPRIVSLDTFADGKPIKIHRSPDCNRAEILARASSAVQTSPAPYHWWSNNCQHLKNYVLKGRRYSEDIQALVSAVAMFGLFVFATKSK